MTIVEESRDVPRPLTRRSRSHPRTRRIFSRTMSCSTSQIVPGGMQGLLLLVPGGRVATPTLDDFTCGLSSRLEATMEGTDECPQPWLAFLNMQPTASIQASLKAYHRPHASTGTPAPGDHHRRDGVRDLARHPHWHHVIGSSS